MAQKIRDLVDRSSLSDELRCQAMAHQMSDISLFFII